MNGTSVGSLCAWGGWALYSTSSAALVTSPPLTPGFPLTEIHPQRREAASGSADDGSTHLVEGHVCSPGEVYYTILSSFPHPLPSTSSTLLSKSWQFDLQINTTVSHCPISISLTQTTISHLLPGLPGADVLIPPTIRSRK